jgi:hypothetical protein
MRCTFKVIEIAFWPLHPHHHVMIDDFYTRTIIKIAAHIYLISMNLSEMTSLTKKYTMLF